jgi:uncharacterized protein YbcI
MRSSVPALSFRSAIEFQRGLAQLSDGVHAVTGDGHDGPSVLMQISNEMVRIYKEQFGRGPTRARTEFAGADLVISTLENSLTKAEQNMVAMGEHQRLRDIRTFFQHASQRDFCDAVERVTGRKVRAFVSGIDTEQDVSSEVFYLEPEQPVSVTAR